MLMGFVLFAVLVAGIFVYLSQQEKQAQAEAQEEKQELPDMSSKAQRDSLVNLLEFRDSVITAKVQINDSLAQVIQTKSDSINNQKQTIANLEQQLVDENNRAENIKNLAKTYESLRVADMGPILKDIKDTTIIDIYNQMSSRKRKNLIQALPPDRAARLTNTLAN